MVEELCEMKLELPSKLVKARKTVITNLQWTTKEWSLFNVWLWHVLFNNTWLEPCIALISLLITAKLLWLIILCGIVYLAGHVIVHDTYINLWEALKNCYIIHKNVTMIMHCLVAFERLWYQHTVPLSEQQHYNHQSKELCH